METPIRKLRRCIRDAIRNTEPSRAVELLQLINHAIDEFRASIGVRDTRLDGLSQRVHELEQGRVKHDDGCSCADCKMGWHAAHSIDWTSLAHLTGPGIAPSPQAVLDWARGKKQEGMTMIGHTSSCLCDSCIAYRRRLESVRHLEKVVEKGMQECHEASTTLAKKMQQLHEAVDRLKTITEQPAPGQMLPTWHCVYCRHLTSRHLASTGVCTETGCFCVGLHRHGAYHEGAQARKPRCSCGHNVIEHGEVSCNGTLDIRTGVSGMIQAYPCGCTKWDPACCREPCPKCRQTQHRHVPSCTGY